MAILPVLTKKFGNRMTMLIAFILMAVFNALKYLFKENIFGLAICVCLVTVGITLAQCMRDMLVIDCMCYGQWKSNTNYEGVYASIKGFADKIALGLASLVTGAILQLGGYDGSMEMQSSAAQSAITFCFAGLPAILGILGIVAMICYNLEPKLKEIEKE